MHNFMSGEQVAGAPHDPTVRARLDGCVFKRAIQRENGTWEAVPMCSMNQSERGSLYGGRLAAAGKLTMRKHVLDEV